jgi:hypothetical protein
VEDHTRERELEARLLLMARAKGNETVGELLNH